MSIVSESGVEWDNIDPCGVLTDKQRKTMLRGMQRLQMLELEYHDAVQHRDHVRAARADARAGQAMRALERYENFIEQRTYEGFGLIVKIHQN